jgi:hypothetical protein
MDFAVRGDGQPVERAGLLTVFGATPTRATITVRPLGIGRRLARALGALLACWAAAAVSVFIPVAHFLLVPGLAIGGLAWAVVRLRARECLVRVHGGCPRCGRVQEFIAAGSTGGQPAVTCPGCLNRLLVTTGVPVSSG